MTQDQTASPIRCLKCKTASQLFVCERLWDLKKARYIRIYRCECGELVWDE
ncbi:hypothetical protein FBZ94_10877 [Bradyrhizobium sacchari]|uniref:Ogr/Delta-like zinc finger protein n=1 Tax=Bradyrhizobium sacchari TaxID=1399419 RepID=A0A560K4J2_9BRAD|nr:hypothetical protein FBZ94_10877 [Bradyrhizobium sacchari]TWB78245.1 hypothetical protein FBZ95_10377 [Bradyrhizobium sacchari]